MTSAPAPSAPERVVRGANVARVQFTAKATALPGGRGRLIARLQPVAPLGGGEAQFAVVGQKVVAGRLYVQVLLAQRPNGTAGWIEADDATLSHTRWSVDVDTEARRVSVAYNGHTVNSFRAVVGRASSPTPHGRFAVSELLEQQPTDRFLGSWVLPLTAFSGTYREFDGGPGRVAIHGRGGTSLLDPLGSAASHGCVRVSNADADWLAHHLEAGVPVTIT